VGYIPLELLCSVIVQQIIKNVMCNKSKCLEMCKIAAKHTGSLRTAERKRVTLASSLSSKAVTPGQRT
jgi:hypothetical protein